MFVPVPRSCKRPVNLTLNEVVVAQAKTFTGNLSATVDALLADYVASQQRAAAEHLLDASNCAQAWNAFNASVGSFADEHSTL